MQSGRVFAQWVTYTSHVIWDCCVCGVISFRGLSVYMHSHVVWDCCVCGVISHSGDQAFIRTVMSFKTVMFVVSYLVQAIERLYAWSFRLRLLCLWCHISFRRSSIYTHGHVIWDCCVCGIISHSGNCAAADYTVWDLYFVIHFECHNNF